MNDDQTKQLNDLCDSFKSQLTAFCATLVVAPTPGPTQADVDAAKAAGVAEEAAKVEAELAPIVEELKA